MADIGVVHLVRQKNGLAPFERFLSSYRDNAAEVPHDLVVIFKGFGHRPRTEEYDRLLSALPHERYFVDDRGFDLEPYFKAVRSFKYRHFCFLNSFSRILAPGWLAKLHRALEGDGVGLVGATGSYQSFATAHDDRLRALAQLDLPRRLRWRVGHVVSDPEPRLVAQRAAAWMLGSLGLWDPRRHFPPFPNYHVRSTAFMASRETLLRMRIGPILFKLSAFLFESGRNSLTRQVLGFGLRPLVVARSGEAFEKEQWHLSNTFRQSRQENLLVADNQTDAYERADARRRAQLSRLAWGQYARPAPR